MNNKKTFWALVGLLAVFAVAFGLDRWVEYARQALTYGQLSPFLWLTSWSLANLFLALCVFLLYTLAFPRLDNWGVAFLIIIGLLVDFIPLIYWLPIGSAAAFLSQFVTYPGYMISAGGWTAAAGLFTLLRRKAQD